MGVSDHIERIRRTAAQLYDTEQQLAENRAELAAACLGARDTGRLKVATIAEIISETRGRPFRRNQVYALITEADKNS